MHFKNLASRIYLTTWNYLKEWVQSQLTQVTKRSGLPFTQAAKSKSSISQNSPIATTYWAVCGISKFPLRQITTLKGPESSIRYPIQAKSTQPYLTVVNGCMVAMKRGLSFLVPMMPAAVFASLQLLTQFCNLTMEKFTSDFNRCIQVHR